MQHFIVEIVYVIIYIYFNAIKEERIDRNLYSFVISEIFLFRYIVIV